MRMCLVLVAILAAAGPAGCVDVRVGPPEADPEPSEARPPAGETAVAFGGDGGGMTDTIERIARIATGVTLGAEHGAVFHAYDTLALPDKPVDLTVRLRSAETLQGVQGVTIAYTLNSAPAEPNANVPPLSEPKPLGEAVTDAQGYASISYTPAVGGDYVISAAIAAVARQDEGPMLKVSPALLVAARPTDAKLVVVDLDHTLVASGFHTVLLGGASPMADSEPVLTEIARGHTVIYLTHRPDLLTLRSKQWLSEHGYPPGPVLLGDLPGLLAGSGSFKSAKLSELRRVYPNVRLGIGDKVSDARSYAENGIAAYLIPHVEDKPKSLRRLAREIRRLPEEVQVVRDWRELRAGVVDGERYLPGRFARWIEERVRALEAREEDDEDD